MKSKIIFFLSLFLTIKGIDPLATDPSPLATKAT